MIQDRHMINQKAFKSLDTVTILRAISCLIIITIHAPLPASLIHAPLGITIATIGFTGIYAFFFLSGYILGKRYLEKKYSLSLSGILTFYWKRLKKIAPLYFIILFILYFLTPENTPGKTQEFIRLLLFIAPEKIHLSGGSYLWFISTIMQMYLLAPIGFALIKILNHQTIRFRICLFAAVLLFGGLIKWFALPNFSYEFTTQSWTLNLYIFLLGMTFSTIKKNVSVSFKLALGIFSFIIIASFLPFTGVLSTTSPSLKLAFQTILIPSLSYLLMASILAFYPLKIPVKTISPLLFFQIVGIFSYEIYLLHQPILNFLNLPCFWQCTPFMFVANIVVVLLISLAIASLLRLLKDIFCGLFKQKIVEKIDKK